MSCYHKTLSPLILPTLNFHTIALSGWSDGRPFPPRRVGVSRSAVEVEKWRSKYKYLSPALNSLGKGNEFEREGGRVNFFLGMSNSVIQFHHYPECRVELEKGPSEGS